MLRRRSLIGLIPLGLMYAIQYAGGNEASPEELAKFGFDIFKHGRIAQFADLLAADALASVRRTWQELLAQAEDFGRQQILNALQVSSPKELNELSNGEFLLRLSRLVLGDLDVLTEYEYVALGHIVERNDLVHVLYQLEATSGFRLPPRPATLVRSEGSWSLGLLGEFTVAASTKKGVNLGLPRIRVRVIGRITLSDETTVVCYRLWTAATSIRQNKVLAAHVKPKDVEWFKALQRNDADLAAFISSEVRTGAQMQIDRMRSLLAE